MPKLVEFFIAIVTCVAALAAGFCVGNHWAPDAIWSAVFGAVAGATCAAVFWGIALFLATLVPSAAVSGHVVGFDFEILLIATPVCGAIAGVMGYRRALPPR
jgi:hypothetical protein